jgi:hypothetical protein
MYKLFGWCCVRNTAKKKHFIIVMSVLFINLA